MVQVFFLVVIDDLKLESLHVEIVPEALFHSLFFNFFWPDPLLLDARMSRHFFQES